MKFRHLHPWTMDYRAAVAVQERLRERIVLAPPPARPRLVAGADVSYDRGDDRFFAAVVVFSLRPWAIVEESVSTGRVGFPYIPGLLSFREAPVLLRAFRRLRKDPDLVIFDGQGIAHPRGLGVASHLGLILDIPSIGCAKSRLVGSYTEPGKEAGSRSPLKLNGRRIGTVLRTRSGVKPVFVSPGHRMNIGGASRWVLKCCRGYRLPEPTRAAHILSNRVRRERRSAR